MAKPTRIAVLSAVLGAFALAASALAVVPNLISYQGRLTNNGGNPLSGTYSITFAIYSVPSGGSPLWTETHPAVTVTAGAFIVNLGSVSPMNSALFADTLRYLGVTVGADPQLSPRTRLVTSPYAFRVSSIDGAAGGYISGNVNVYGGIWADNVFNTAAIFGNATSTDAFNNMGVNGVASGGKNVNIGVRGYATDGYATGGYNCAAIYGQQQSVFGGTIWAGYFDGWVNVTGTLTAGAKFFKIDDPQKPAERTLTHACVESDKYRNIYDGSVVMDANGQASITLPDWFDDLNGDYHYQLTCIGGHAPVYIATEIANNAFTIAGGNPGLKVSWQVTGVRKDAYALAHPINIVEEKVGVQKGKYLHPIELGKSIEEGVDHATQKAIEDQQSQSQMQTQTRTQTQTQTRTR